MKFKKVFNLRLDVLEKLTLGFCDNILLFNDNNYINLKLLSLFGNHNIKSHYPLKLPEIKKCNLSNSNDIEKDFNFIIDFSSLNKVKQLRCSINNFLLLNNSLLEKITLFSTNNISKETEIKMLDKILSIKTLKNIEFDLSKLILMKYQKYKM